MELKLVESEISEVCSIPGERKRYSMKLGVCCWEHEMFGLEQRIFI